LNFGHCSQYRTGSKGGGFKQDNTKIENGKNNLKG